MSRSTHTYIDNKGKAATHNHAKKETQEIINNHGHYHSPEEKRSPQLVEVEKGENIQTERIAQMY